MMPHLGVLSTVNEQAATEVFTKDCMVYLGTCVAPIGTAKPGDACVEYTLTFPDGREVHESLAFGELKLHPLDEGQEADIEATPARSFDLGEGKGKTIRKKLTGGVVGIAMDARGRPLRLVEDRTERVRQITAWSEGMGLYADAPPAC